jgi:type III secretion system HrpB2-like protein
MTEVIVPIEAVSASLVIDKATTRAPATAAAVDHFNSLMAQQPHEVQPSAEHNDHSAHGANAVSKFVGSQESMMRQTFDDVRAFSMNASNMDAQSMMSRHIELTYQVAMVQAQFNAGVYTAQSVKNGTQTLVKNQ